MPQYLVAIHHLTTALRPSRAKRCSARHLLLK
jgi:hypothetical protein